MTSELSLEGPEHGPAQGGAPDALVILLHGWGADGNDLIGLAPPWAQILPGAHFVSPHAPFPCDMNPMGRQWFSLGDMRPEGDMAEPVVRARLDAIGPLVNGFIDEQLARFSLAADRLALVGFSQGTMTSLYFGVRRPEPPAAILGYSGRLFGGAALAEEAAVKPPVMLIHGEADEMLPAASTLAAERDLKAAGFPVEAHIRPGLGHGIDPEGLQLGGAFLQKHL